MEKSSHLREATMVLSGGRGRGGFTATLSYSIALFLFDDAWSGPHISQNQPRHHCSEHYLQQIIKRLRPSSWHWVSRVWTPDKSPMNDIHWGVTIVHDSSQLNACLTHSKEGCHLKALRSTIQIERDAPLKLKQQSRKLSEKRKYSSHTSSILRSDSKSKLAFDQSSDFPYRQG